MKYCGMVAAALGLEASFIPRIAKALEPGERPPVVWLQFAECTGCSESLLRWSELEYPGEENTRLYIDHVILNAISVDYHETLMAPSGLTATGNLEDVLNTYNGEFICICEGAIPTKDNGVYGMIGGKTMLQIAREVCPKAKAVICYGTCSSFGGLPAAAGGLTKAKSVHDALGGFPTINISGCPPNPFNLVATIVNNLLGTAPLVLDANGRPNPFYQNPVHSLCHYRGSTPNLPCLASKGCRGQKTYNNCSFHKFNEQSKWPVEVDAPCYGCSEPHFWDRWKDVDGTLRDGSFFRYPA